MPENIIDRGMITDETKVENLDEDSPMLQFDS